MSLENTWQEITDHSSIQTLSRSFRFTSSCWGFFSSVHSTHQGRTLGRSWQKLHFVLSYTFLCWFWCLFWTVVLMEDPTTAHYKISSRRRQVLIFYLFLFDRIHNTMYLNKMSRTSSRKICPQHIRSSSIFNRRHGVLFIPVCIKHICWVCCQKSLSFSFYLPTEACPIWRSSHVWPLNMPEFVLGWCSWIFLETLPNNNMWWCWGCLIIFVLGFLTPRLN